MADIVSIHATSHTPVMINFPDAIPDDDRNRIFATFREVGQSILEADPDVVVVVSDDHMHNFFLDNLPAVCIGAANTYETPVEHWLKLDRQKLRGDAQLGSYLIRQALDHDFDPAFSMELTLDHATLAPLHLAGLAQRVSVVPVMINCVQPPLPSMRRALQWGQFLGRALRSYPGCQRVAVLATGGLSHDIATPRMGLVNDGFDREFLRRLAAGDDSALLAYATEHVNEAGNGAEEVRTWLMAHGAALGGQFEALYYQPIPNWYTGIGLGRWLTGASA